MAANSIVARAGKADLPRMARAFDLPGIDTARVWEPEPATVYFWER